MIYTLVSNMGFTHSSIKIFYLINKILPNLWIFTHSPHASHRLTCDIAIGGIDLRSSFLGHMGWFFHFSQFFKIGSIHMISTTCSGITPTLDIKISQPQNCWDRVNEFYLLVKDNVDSTSQVVPIIPGDWLCPQWWKLFNLFFFYFSNSRYTYLFITKLFNPFSIL